MKNKIFIPFIIACLLLPISLLVYNNSEYWFDDFLRTEYMQAKLWPKISSRINSFSYREINVQNCNKYQTEHFTIYYRTNNLETVQKVARTAELIYRPTCDLLKYTRSEKTTIILRPITDSDNDFNAFAGVIRIADTIAQNEDYTPEAILAHEFAHVLLYDMTRSNMATWLDEGIATYVESHFSQKEQYDLHNKDYDYTYKIQELENNFRQIPSNQSYCQSYLSVKYIVSHYGEDTLFQIIKELKDNRVKEETVFKKALGLDYQTFNEKLAEYKQELRDQQG